MAFYGKTADVENIRAAERNCTTPKLTLAMVKQYLAQKRTDFKEAMK